MTVAPKPPTTHPNTLAEALAEQALDADTLRRRYGVFMTLGRRILGVTPDCYRWMGLWDLQAGNRPAAPCMDTYNLLVPSLLNLPPLLRYGHRLKAQVGLATLASSIAAGCRYCQAHTACFAARRGVDVLEVMFATRLRDRPDLADQFDPKHLAAIRVAEALGTIDVRRGIPNGMTPQLRRDLERLHSERDTEWIVCAAVLMGFLNKIMDAFGIPVEEDALTVAGRVIADYTPGKHGPAGWTPPPPTNDRSWAPPRDTRATFLAMLPGAPALLWRSRPLTEGVPKHPRDLQQFLARRTGYEWPEVARLQNRQPRRALGAMLAMDADPRTTVLGLRAKAAAGHVFATTIKDTWLTPITERIYRHAADMEARQGGGYWTRVGGDHTAAAQNLADAISESPSTIGPKDVAAATASLSPAQIVETIHTVSKLQALHRLAAYYNTPA